MAHKGYNQPPPNKFKTSQSVCWGTDLLIDSNDNGFTIMVKERLKQLMEAVKEEILRDIASSHMFIVAVAAVRGCEF